MALFGSSSNEQELTIVLRARNEINAALTKAKAEVEGFGKSLEKQSRQYDAMAKVGTAAFAAVGFAVYGAVKAYQQSETQQVRLAHILKTATGATDAQIEALNRQADALQAVGVVSDDTITTAQAQLATFDLTAGAIERLTPAFLDMVVAEKGVNATTEDMITLGNGLGKVLQGQTDGLSRQGFVFDDATKNLLEHGNETQKVEALVKILGSTYDGLNERMRETAEGGMKGFQMELEKIAENVGGSLVPALNSITRILTPIVAAVARFTAENGKMISTVLLATTALAGWMATMGGLGIIIPKVITAVLGFARAVSVANLAFAALGTAITVIVSKFLEFADEVGGVGNAWNLWMISIQESFWSFVRSVVSGIDTVLNVIPGLGSALDATIAGIDDRISGLNVKFQAFYENGVAGSKKLEVEGPKGFAAVGNSADEAAKKIEAANKQIEQTERQIKELQKGFLDEITDARTSAAEAYVSQEQKVKDLKHQMREEDDKKEKDKLERAYLREKEALESKVFMEASIGEAINEARRRSRLTDFERELEDIKNRVLARATEFQEKMALLKQELVEQKKKRDEIMGLEAQTTQAVLAEANHRETETVKSINRQIKAYGALRDAATGGSTRQVSLGGVSMTSANSTPMFEHGGIVPGAPGKAVPIIAHSGERIIPASQADSGPSSASITVNIYNPSVQSQQDVELLKGQLNKALRGLMRDHKLSVV